MRYYFKGIEGMNFAPCKTIIVKRTQHGMAFIEHPEGYLTDGKKLLMVDIKRHLESLTD